MCNKSLDLCKNTEPAQIEKEDWRCHFYFRVDEVQPEFEYILKDTTRFGWNLKTAVIRCSFGHRTSSQSLDIFKNTGSVLVGTRELEVLVILLDR